jgi:beta-galactosidase
MARRDKAPLIETEDLRDEAGRNVWDDYSPPHFGFKPVAGTIGGRPTDSWHWNSETFCLAGRHALHQLRRNRIRQPRSRPFEMVRLLLHLFHRLRRRRPPAGQLRLRVSGKVDGVRLPKEAY